MEPTPLNADQMVFKPLTLTEWQDFEQLFQEHGPQNGCWCMYWRTSRAECQRGFGEGNKQAFSDSREREGTRYPGIPGGKSDCLVFDRASRGLPGAGALTYPETGR